MSAQTTEPKRTPPAPADRRAAFQKLAALWAEPVNRLPFRGRGIGWRAQSQKKRKP